MRTTRLITTAICCAALLTACGSKKVAPAPTPAAPLESRQSLETKAKAGDAGAQFELGAAAHLPTADAVLETWSKLT